MRAALDTLIPTGAQSLGSDWTSEALYTNQIYLLSIMLVFTGSPSGTFKLEASNDAYDSKQGPQNWSEIPGSSVIITEAGDHTWNFTSISTNWIRVVYTRASGTGSLTSAQYHGKGV